MLNRFSEGFPGMKGTTSSSLRKSTGRYQENPLKKGWWMKRTGKPGGFSQNHLSRWQ